MQKEVKIIGLRVNQKMGILESFSLEFDENNKLISILGEVGSGKTTMQKALQLGTLGSETLKEDKSLYGGIDQEVQLLDGETSVYVGSKTNTKGAIDYVIFTKDENGKVIKDPILDGVKLTPSKYLKELQTSLTWRMEELCSENTTTQKKLLLELYKSELAGAGVIFDKKSTEYSNSILGKIELAVNDRSEKEFLRKQIGGFQNQLEPLGIDTENGETHPVYVDLSALEASKNKISYKIENTTEVRDQELKAIINKADAVTVKIKDRNSFIKSENEVIKKEFEAKKEAYSQNIHTLNGIKTDLKTLFDAGCYNKEGYETTLHFVTNQFVNKSPMCATPEPTIEFQDGKVVSNSAEWNGCVEGKSLLIELEKYKLEYKTKLSEQNDTTKLEEELSLVVQNLYLAKENNKKVEMLNSFLSWQESNNEVLALRAEYSSLLASINTGVDGLKINVDNSGSDVEIFLTYNGSYDPVYFGNSNKEDRKLSSYSGTQKPVICLLLQSYLLSNKPKALRYLWIDNVPIDKKTKMLLNKMGEELGVTIIVNITGDFDKNELGEGDILINGGEIFFK